MRNLTFIILVAVLTFTSWTIINAYVYAIDGNDMQFYDLVAIDNQTEARSFQDCFSEGMGILTLALIFAPTEKLSAMDLIDPAFKKMIINMCNFYHEKTRIWINMMSDGDIIQRYNYEFTRNMEIHFQKN
jgi:hypothetical protein